MIRTQIQLTEEQARALRELASRDHRSMADLVRESVSEYLARRRPTDRGGLARQARELAGRFRSGRPDLAEEHDRHLEEAFSLPETREAPPSEVSQPPRSSGR
jgi:predicted transcriptional regulator